MPINLTETEDPHHSLLIKPEVLPAISQDQIDEINESAGSSENNSVGLPQNPPMVKDSVYWWGKSKK